MVFPGVCMALITRMGQLMPEEATRCDNLFDEAQGLLGEMNTSKIPEVGRSGPPCAGYSNPKGQDSTGIPFGGHLDHLKRVFC